MSESPTGEPAEMEEVRRRMRALEEQLALARHDAARLAAILESATDYAIMTVAPDLRITSWNIGARNLLGWSEAEAIGLDSRVLFIPEDRERGAPEAELARAVADGRAANERWHQRRDGSRFWGSGLMLPLRGGPAPGFLKIMRDRTERREADERQTLLLRELAHRVKNTLAMILSMARQTGVRSQSIDDFLDRFEGRLMALASAHELLSASGWRSTPLPKLVKAALAAHGEPEGEPIRIRTENLLVRPAAAQSLVLVLHELATNAIKHGALSRPGGTLTIEGRALAEELVLTWHETGGPPAAPPSTPGFGTTLLEQVITRQHGGTVTFAWQPEGLACTLRLPLTEIQDRTEPAPAVVPRQEGGAA